MAEGGKYEIRDGKRVLIERTGYTPEPVKQQERKQKEVSREDAEKVYSGKD